MTPVDAYIAQRLPLLPFRVEPARLLDDARILLKAVLGWQQATLTQEKDGVTNLLLKCTHNDEAVLIRVYGDATDTIISRSRELENFVTLHLQGYAPEVLNRFENGLVYRYVQGKALDLKSVSEPRYAKATAALLGEWHCAVPHAQTNDFWPTLKAWVHLVPEDAPQTKTWLLNTLTTLERDAKSASDLLVFSHNDLLPPNIIAASNEDETVSFIDYEYACTHDPHFDIANHFLEYAGFECDWSALPTEDFQRMFVSTYLESFNNTAPNQADIEATLEKIKEYMNVSHFYWATWALVQASISKIDFDYAGYAQRRFSALATALELKSKGD